MRSSIFFMFHKVVTLLLILVIGITSFATPAFAYDGSNEQEPFVEKLVKDTAITVVTATAAFFVPPAICLTADAVATAFFPPAAMLAPYCASIGFAASAASATTTAGIGSARIVQEAIAH